MSVHPIRPVDEGVIHRLSAPVGLTVAEEVAVAWSWAQSWQHRYQAVRVRQYRLVIVGLVVGAVGAWMVDGRLAQVTDRALRAVGL